MPKKRQGRAGKGAAPKKAAKTTARGRRAGKMPRSGRPAVKIPPVAKAKSGEAQGVLCRIVKLGRAFGFAAPLDGTPDIFIPGHALRGAMQGDEVLVAPFARPRVPGSREGEVIKIVSENNRLVGTMALKGKWFYFLPDNMPGTELRVIPGGEGAAAPGDKVAAEVVSRAALHQDHQVAVTVCFGSSESAAECAKAIVYAAGVSTVFPDEALRQALPYADTRADEAEISRREDLRGECIFTIDSASTKDIDDAISARETPEGYEVGVHIADVSHYVGAGSPLDEEALLRGTSIYYADSVIPMLPPELSNGICSLNEGEDRLAFSCLMKLDKNAKLQEYRFVKTVIHSCVKGVYSEINALLEGDAGQKMIKKYENVQENLFVMRDIYYKLAALRTGRGNIDIESEEPKIVLNEAGICTGIEKRDRGLSEKLIEEFMLLANGAAAMLAREKQLPFVYRVHEAPSADKLEQLKSILSAAGVEYRFAGDVPTQQELAKILDATRDTTMAYFVHNGILRSMAKAKYEPIPKGHYGLALADYAHFTSPIRRYPDLAIHRILSAYVSGVKDKALHKAYTAFAAQASLRSSEGELTAQRIERDCDECYKAEYMRPFIGQVFEGVVSSVVAFGLYVQLGNTVEGLVHASHLSTGELTLAKGISLTDPVTGKSYRVGQVLQVKLLAVDIAQGNIDFGLD